MFSSFHIISFIFFYIFFLNFCFLLFFPLLNLHFFAVEVNKNWSPMSPGLEFRFFSSSCSIPLQRLNSPVYPIIHLCLSQGHYQDLKCKQPQPGFELKSLNPFFCYDNHYTKTVFFLFYILFNEFNFFVYIKHIFIFYCLWLSYLYFYIFFLLFFYFLL